MNTNIIETNGLTKGTGSQMRVNHIDLRVPEGCVYGFLGPNGAGKTTTLKLLLGLLKPNCRHDHFLRAENDRKKQALHTKAHRKPDREPKLLRTPHRTGKSPDHRKAEKVPASEITQVLQTVRLYEQRDKKVRQYSLGMKQRLGIAMALLGNPRVLILDEPTNGLDPAGIQEIREFIRELPVIRQMTVIVSSHLLSEMEQMADMVGIINHGRLIFQDTLAALESRGENLEDAFLKMTEGGERL